MLLTAIIWFLKIYRGGLYCTFPHAMEILNQNYKEYLPVLMSYPELSQLLRFFHQCVERQCPDQLRGRLAFPLGSLYRMASPALYWVMTGDDFTLDINNPEDPKILWWVITPTNKISTLRLSVCTTLVSVAH